MIGTLTRTFYNNANKIIDRLRFSPWDRNESPTRYGNRNTGIVVEFRLN